MFNNNASVGYYCEYHARETVSELNAQVEKTPGRARCPTPDAGGDEPTGRLETGL